MRNGSKDTHKQMCTYTYICKYVCIICTWGLGFRIQGLGFRDVTPTSGESAGKEAH